MLLAVLIGVVVLALVVLGALTYTLLGALRRLGREVQALERELRPVLDQAQATSARAAAIRH